ncbi:MAG: DUF721 domain-containing protein [Elusimicrobia bacterium]|nr:DUF721 domain-containing protein [Elusimicrobiota bacterium]
MVDKKNPPRLLQDLLPQVIARIQCVDPARQVSVEAAWRKVAGQDPKGTRIGGFRDGTLLVHVDSPARLFVMRMRRQTLLSGIQKDCPEVINIVFKIGKDT